MRREKTKTEFHAPLMLAFREAFDAHDAKAKEPSSAEGERVVAGRNSRHRRGDEAALKRNLAQDLVSLMNTIDLDSAQNLDGLDYVRKSIINFGLYDIGHLTSDEIAVDGIRNDLRESLLNYEPRLNADTLIIEREKDNDDVNQRVCFTVSAEMLCTPVDVPVDFVAEVDLGSGKVHITRLPASA